jgi:hypothetical protein
MAYPSWTTDYQAVPASTTARLAGQNGVGLQGDILSELLIIPTTVAAGSVQIKDGTGTAITVFTAETALVDLKPFVITLGIRSVVGPWSVITGANVAVLARGRFQ